jgi:hypothetical protein
MVSFIKLVFTPLPTVAATPTSVIDGGTWITDQISAVVSVFNMVYGATLFSALILIILAIINFEWIYHTLMWVIKKIPMINIK